MLWIGVFVVGIYLHKVTFHTKMHTCRDHTAKVNIGILYLDTNANFYRSVFDIPIISPILYNC